MQWRELVKNNSSILLISVLNYALTYVMNVYIARVFSPEAYGDFFVTYRVLLIILPFSLLGTQIASNRFLSQYYKKDTPRFLGFYRWTLRIFTTSSIMIAILGLALVIAIILGDHYHFIVLEDIHLATFALWILPLLALSMLQSAFLQSIQNYTQSMIASLLYPIVMFACLFILHQFIPVLSPYHLIALIGLAYVFIIYTQRNFINKNLTALDVSKENQADFSQKKLWLTTSLGMMINSFIGLCLSNIYLLMLEMFSPNDAEVGYFSSIFMITGSLMLVGVSVNYILNPLISPLLEQKKYSELFKLIANTTILKASIGAVIVVALIVFGRSILGHFGPSYRQYYPELMIITASTYIYLLLSVSQTLLLFSENQLLQNCITSGELVCALILTSILIPKYNLFGAIISMAVSLSLSSIASTVMAIWLFSKKIKAPLSDN